jgi:hypothetical protein
MIVIATLIGRLLTTYVLTFCKLLPHLRNTFIVVVYNVTVLTNRKKQRNYIFKENTGKCVKNLKSCVPS